VEAKHAAANDKLKVWAETGAANAWGLSGRIVSPQASIGEWSQRAVTCQMFFVVECVGLQTEWTGDYASRKPHLYALAGGVLFPEELCGEACDTKIENESRGCQMSHRYPP
jgi:hypothetical protein